MGRHIYVHIDVHTCGGKRCTLGASPDLAPPSTLRHAQSPIELAELNLCLTELISDIGWLANGIKGLACLHIVPQHSGYKIHLYNSWWQLSGGYLESNLRCSSLYYRQLMTQTFLQLHQIWCYMNYKCIL